MSFRSLHQSGFTLLELLLVVGILAIIGGAMMVSYGNSGSDSVTTRSQIKAAQLEMSQIRQALLRYRADNLSLPASSAQRSAVDAEFLFVSGANPSVSAWNDDYQKGWRGPYLGGGDSGLVDIGDNLDLFGNGSPTQISTTAQTLIRAIPDPFSHRPVPNNHSSSSYSARCEESGANDQCLLDWRYLGQADNKPPHPRFGRPYLLLELDPALNGTPRIVSLGPNGRYEGRNNTNPCAPPDNSDDLVLCLN